MAQELGERIRRILGCFASSVEAQVEPRNLACVLRCAVLRKDVDEDWPGSWGIELCPPHIHSHQPPQVLVALVAVAQGQDRLEALKGGRGSEEVVSFLLCKLSAHQPASDVRVLRIPCLRLAISW